MAIIRTDQYSGGSRLTPSGSAGDPDLAQVQRSFVDDIAAVRGGVQGGVATLVAGSATINAGVAFGANARILVSVKGAITGSTDFAAVTVAVRTPGAEGVATFTVVAIVPAGTIDSDAAGDVDWIIFDGDIVGDQQNTKG